MTNATPRKRILTGVRPTGALHLGHYVGALENWVRLQDEYDCFFLIADYQALGDHMDDIPGISRSVVDVALDWLAVGLDPEKSTFVVQSYVPEHAELALLLSMVTPLGWLERNPTLKAELQQLRSQLGGGRVRSPFDVVQDLQGEQQRKSPFDVVRDLEGEQRQKSPLDVVRDLQAERRRKSPLEASQDWIEKGVGTQTSVGFFTYPVSQVADILLPKAHLVPVGEDQLPHIEMTREVARRFNRLFGETFPEPEALVGRVARLPGTDGQAKMSKSLGNVILLSDDEETVNRKVRGMYTDPKRIRADIPADPEGNPVFAYHDAFNYDKAEVEDLKERYRGGRVGDVEVKRKLAVALNRFLSPIRERRAHYQQRPDTVREALIEGSRQAKRVAEATMLEVREKMGILYFGKG